MVTRPNDDRDMADGGGRTRAVQESDGGLVRRRWCDRGVDWTKRQWSKRKLQGCSQAVRRNRSGHDWRPCTGL
ncbi:thioredoxin family protein [Sesbania bispinosa]|nr:thioredoxin family protein [Sesbania bispinosa]